MTVFETIRVDDEVEDAIIAVLRKWLPTYMSEVERQIGLAAGFYTRPFYSSYTTRTDFEVWPEDMLPVVSVEGLGVEDDPKRDGRGRIRARYAVGVVNVCSSNDALYVREYASRMGAAIRAALLQHQSLEFGLDGTVRGVTFVGSRPNRLASQDERTIRDYRQLFIVEVGDVLTRGAGPVAPDADPPVDPTTPLPEWPTVPDRAHVVVSTEVSDD
jgi:hypothetical protein